MESGSHLGAFKNTYLLDHVFIPIFGFLFPLVPITLMIIMPAITLLINLIPLSKIRFDLSTDLLDTNIHIRLSKSNVVNILVIGLQLLSLAMVALFIC